MVFKIGNKVIGKSPEILNWLGEIEEVTELNGKIAYKVIFGLKGFKLVEPRDIELAFNTGLTKMEKVVSRTRQKQINFNKLSSFSNEEEYDQSNNTTDLIIETETNLFEESSMFNHDELEIHEEKRLYIIYFYYFIILYI